MGWAKGVNQVVCSSATGRSHFPDWVGQTFGTLEVKGVLGLNKNQHRVYRCICTVCSSERNIESQSLRRMSNKGCRCFRGKLEDKRFGRLWVLFKSNKDSGKNRRYI